MVSRLLSSNAAQQTTETFARGNLTPAERFDYTAAMHCLARLPSKTPSDFAPGARSRFDDFLVGHIVNTLTVHFSGFFLPWHRQLVWEMEQALRNECNYKGYHPYWDWSKWADLAPESNPLWDGSNTSISGNGVYVPHGTINVTLPGGGLLFETPPGTGGGCIYNGPFANWSVNLGPVSGLDGFGGPPNPRPDGLGYNPHCIYRDFDAGLLRSQNSYRNVTQLILNSTSKFSARVSPFDRARADVCNDADIHEFHPEAEMGVHGGGHTFIGGGNNDLFASAGDPAFYMHHTMFDRIWAIWQSRDFDSRVYKDGLDGTHTFFNGETAGAPFGVLFPC